MPNRIIKESICASDSLDQLSWFEECFFYRLIVNCDDLDKVSEKTLELLNNAYDHEYTKDDILNFASAICKIFDIVGAPKYHVPFILVILAKL